MIKTTHSTMKRNKMLESRMRRVMKKNLTRTSRGQKVSQVAAKSARLRRDRVRLASLRRIASLMQKSKIASRRKKKTKMLAKQLLSRL